MDEVKPETKDPATWTEEDINTIINSPVDQEVWKRAEPYMKEYWEWMKKFHEEHG